MILFNCTYFYEMLFINNCGVIMGTGIGKALALPVAIVAYLAVAQIACHGEWPITVISVQLVWRRAPNEAALSPWPELTFLLEMYCRNEK